MDVVGAAVVVGRYLAGTPKDKSVTKDLVHQLSCVGILKSYKEFTTNIMECVLHLTLKISKSITFGGDHEFVSQLDTG